MAAKTGKYVKRMETLMKAYKIDDKYPITIMRLLAQFEHELDSNRVSEDTSICVVPNFMKDGPAASLTFRMSPEEDVLREYPLFKVG